MNGTFFLIVFSVMYSKNILTLLLAPSQRKNVQLKNTKLDHLRKMPVKSVEQQKEFLKLKQGRKVKTPFKKKIFPFICDIIIFILLYQIFNRVYGTLYIPVWVAILLVIGMSIGINYVLQKYNVSTDTLWRIIK